MLTKFIGTLSAAQFGQNAWAQQILADLPVSNDAQPTCEEQPFCDRFRQFMDHADLRTDSDVYYSVDQTSVTGDYKSGKVTATLNLASKSDGTVSQSLDMTLTFYQNGIIRMLMTEPGVERFRISQEAVQPVVDEQLVAADLTDKVTWSDDKQTLSISGLKNEQGDEDWTYVIELPRFRINQYQNG